MSKKNKNVYFNLFNVEDNIDQENEAAVEEDASNEHYFSIAALNFDQKQKDQQNELNGQISMLEDEAFESTVNQMQEDGRKSVSDSEESLVAQTDEHTEDKVESAGDDGLLHENGSLIEEFSEEIISTDEAVEKITEPIQEFFIEPVVKDKGTVETEITEDSVEEESTEKDDVSAVKNEQEESADDISAKKDPVEEMLVSALETNSLDESYVPEKNEFSEESANIFENILEYNAIKNQSHMDSFETPYVYHGKTGDKVRYRLSLPSDNDPKHNRLKKNITDWVITIALALILAFIIRMFLFFATVDGPSMQPTLTDNDRLLVTTYTYHFQDIKRGDIVICKYNDPAYPDRYVKRVIGLPGETISIIDGVVYINDEALEENYTIKSLPGLDHYHNMDAYYIPEGHVFVMGDNRNNSADSRMITNGAISTDLIIGKAQIRIFPFNNMGSLEESN